MSIQVLLKSSQQIDSDFIVRVEQVTEEQFDAFATEDSRCELLDNVLIMHSPANVEHENVFGFIYVLLRAYVERKDLGQVLGSQALIHPRTGHRLAPDVMFVSCARAPFVDKQVEGTADLVVELLSRSTRSYDLGDKRHAYQDARTPEIRLIDPARRSVVIDVRSGRTYKSHAQGTGRLRSKAVKGFWLDVSWLWQRPLAKTFDCLERVLAEPA